MNHKDRKGKWNSPKEVFFDAGDGIHAANFCPGTDQLHPNMCSNFDHHILVIRELGRCRIRVELDIRGDELHQC
jgi:hypothetical protein